MALTTGTRLGLYEIHSLLGAGGMGEVYRAKDTKLGRDVVVKVLPEAFAFDPERVARFKREAQVLASLNHPHIAALYGMEEADGRHFLIMELVEGETLAERLRRGAIRVEDALKIAHQVTDALDAAHEKGIVHRDLKPANVKITRDGVVKVLDFGLAKTRANLAEADLTSAPTATVAPTMHGVVMGTAPYMSPEQARGQTVDKRADIWAFGCVLYEMLTGQRAFTGDTSSETIARILEREPDWSALPPSTPAMVRRLLQRCLERDLRRRQRDIGDARLDLGGREDSGVVLSTVAVPRRAPWQTALLLAGVAAISAVATWSLAPRPQSRLVERALVSIAPAADFGRPPLAGLSLSPDGRQFVFSAVLNGEAEPANPTLRLYVRPIDRLEAQPIKGTEGGMGPVFSPDGLAVAFIAQGKVMRVGLDGAPPVALASVSMAGQSVGLSWFSNGDVLFASSGQGLSRALAGGGNPAPVTTVDLVTGERHLFPFVLPGDQAILFTSVPTSGWDDAEIVVQSLSDGRRHTVIKGGVDARYVEPGYLVYLKSETLMAVRFDPRTLRVNGEAVALLEGVRVSLNALASGGETSAGQFAVSRSGTLLYVGGGARPDPQTTLVWVDRDGAVQPLNAPTTRSYASPRLSPEGERVALSSRHAGATDIWVYDIPRGSLTRQTARYSNTVPQWSPDSSRLAFSSTANGFRNVFWTKVDGRGAPERLTTLAGPNFAQDPSSWSPDGRRILFTERTGGRKRALMILAVGENRPPSAWLEPQGTYEYRSPQFSPDGRYVAYSSDETGRFEIYVRPFEGEGRLVPVSNAGGTEPLWAPRGRELFYRDGDRVMAVDASTAPVLTVGKARELFSGTYVHGVTTRDYDVTADGKRFLMVKDAPEAPEPPTTHITLVVNWVEELKARVPVK